MGPQRDGVWRETGIVEQAGRYWRWNDQSELILAKLTPSGYEELSRAKLLPTIEHTGGRDVLWCHPAFANRRAYVHTGQELLCVFLAATNMPPSVVPAA